MSTGTRILYVDDEPDIREIAVMSLQLNPDFDVRSASSGEEALSIAAEWHPDIIMLDVMMPDMDGPTTRQKLAADESTASIPVIFVTARTQQQEVERFMALDAAGVIAKPFDPMTLADQVTKLVAAKV